MGLKENLQETKYRAVGGFPVKSPLNQSKENDSILILGWWPMAGPWRYPNHSTQPQNAMVPTPDGARPVMESRYVTKERRLQCPNGFEWNTKSYGFSSFSLTNVQFWCNPLSTTWLPLKKVSPLDGKSPKMFCHEMAIKLGGHQAVPPFSGTNPQVSYYTIQKNTQKWPWNSPILFPFYRMATDLLAAMRNVRLLQELIGDVPQTWRSDKLRTVTLL